MSISVVFLIFSQSLFIFSQGQVDVNAIAHENWDQSRKLKPALTAELEIINKNDATGIRTF